MVSTTPTTTYFATAASRFSEWWSGERRSPALTADADSGAGLQGGNEGEVQPPNGDAITAPSADSNPRSQPDLVAQLFDPRAGQEAGLVLTIRWSHRLPSSPFDGVTPALRR